MKRVNTFSTSDDLLVPAAHRTLATRNVTGIPPKPCFGGNFLYHPPNIIVSLPAVTTLPAYIGVREEAGNDEHNLDNLFLQEPMRYTNEKQPATRLRTKIVPRAGLLDEHKLSSATLYEPSTPLTTTVVALSRSARPLLNCLLALCLRTTTITTTTYNRRFKRPITPTSGPAKNQHHLPHSQTHVNDPSVCSWRSCLHRPSSASA